MDQKTARELVSSGSTGLVSGSPNSAVLGRRQAVRHRFLVPASGGSNPPAPAIQILSLRFRAETVTRSSGSESNQLRTLIRRFGIVAIPPSTAQGLEQGGGIGIAVGLCLD